MVFDINKCKENDDSSLKRTTLISDMENVSSLINATVEFSANKDEFVEETKHLYMSDGDLRKLPDFSHVLEKLKNLNIKCNNLSIFPSITGVLQNLQVLDLSNNQITEVPESLSGLKQLKELYLQNNLLKDLPEALIDLHHLEILNISCNSFDSIPYCIECGLDFLKVLDVSKNYKMKLNVMPRSIYLEKFVAQGNKNCEKFPDWILFSHYIYLKEVYLDGTQFDIYNFISTDRYSNVEILSITASNISDKIFARMTRNMVKLKKIYLGNDNNLLPSNIFSTIPTAHLKCPSLITELSLKAGGISVIPTSIVCLKNLVKMDISCNDVSWLPKEFSQLEKLEILDVESNGLINFLETFGNLKSLKELKAAKNLLSSLPESFRQLSCLEYLDLFDNSFLEFPNIIQQLNSLKGLDLNFNYFPTANIKIKTVSYEMFHKGLLDYYTIENRAAQNNYKILKEELINLDEEESTAFKYIDYESDCETDASEVPQLTSFEEEEDWDQISNNSDDQFDPTEYADTKTVVVPRKRIYPSVLNNFCPKDLHALNIKKEVNQMRAHGSYPIFKIQEGQFDDA